MKKHNDYILELRNVSKHYPSVAALDNVSFRVRRKSILSIVGENGAGKSTLLKIISGVIPSSKFTGHVLFDGKIIDYNNVNDSRRDGIAIIHQELATSPHLSLHENIFLGHYKQKWGILHWNDMMVQAKYFMNLVGLHCSPEELAGSLTVANQQLLEIAKALAKNAQLLILDEPTSSLNDSDSFALLDIMRRLRDENGITCIFVSHKLKEVAYIADEITVLRDGKHISDYSSSNEAINEERLIRDIVGRELTGKFPPRKHRAVGNLALQVSNLNVEDRRIKGKMVVKNLSFDVRYGEVVGISGLVGSGRSEMAMNIFGRCFGIRRSGTIRINNHVTTIKSPSQAIRNGLMYASEDRKTEGLIQMFSIKENIALAATSRHTICGIVRHNIELQEANLLRNELHIKVPNLDEPTDSLSGGNQQKVLLAKSLATGFNILIVDEPTKGIDVGAKFEIYEIINQLASQGKAIVIISSEIEELLAITNRIYVMSQGTIKGQIATHEATPEKIMQIAIGQKYIN